MPLQEQNFGTGNINDTNVNTVRLEAYGLMEYLLDKNNIVLFKEQLSRKYNLLYNTSKSLFELIIKDSISDNFNKTAFTDKLDKMLDLVDKIQKSQISQLSASEEIGKNLAETYIDVCKK